MSDPYDGNLNDTIKELRATIARLEAERDEAATREKVLREALEYADYELATMGMHESGVMRHKIRTALAPPAPKGAADAK